MSTKSMVDYSRRHWKLWDYLAKHPYASKVMALKILFPREGVYLSGHCYPCEASEILNAYHTNCSRCPIDHCSEYDHWSVLPSDFPKNEEWEKKRTKLAIAIRDKEWKGRKMFPKPGSK